MYGLIHFVCSHVDFELIKGDHSGIKVVFRKGHRIRNQIDRYKLAVYMYISYVISEYRDYTVCGAFLC